MSHRDSSVLGTLSIVCIVLLPGAERVGRCGKKEIAECRGAGVRPVPLVQPHGQEKLQSHQADAAGGAREGMECVKAQANTSFR